MYAIALRSGCCENVSTHQFMTGWWGERGGGCACLRTHFREAKQANTENRRWFPPETLHERCCDLWTTNLPSSAFDNLEVEIFRYCSWRHFFKTQSGFYLRVQFEQSSRRSRSLQPTVPKPRSQKTKTPRFIISTTATWNSPVIQLWSSDNKTI